MKATPAQVLQHAALAAHGFADEKRFGLGVIQAGGMKLDEFHVGDGRPGPVGHGHAVAGRDVRIGRVKIYLAAAARGQHDTARGEGFDHAAVLVQHVGAQAAIERRSLPSGSFCAVIRSMAK